MAVVVATAVVLIGLPCRAAAHGGVLDYSTPAEGAAVAELPQIVLRFTTPILTEYSQFVLTQTGGTPITLQPTYTPDSQTVTLQPATTVPDGGYRLAYRIVSDDGHPVTATIGFTVGDTTATPPPAPTTRPSEPGILDAERFERDKALPWVLGGAGLLVIAAFVYLLTRRPQP
ncbi:copper resistance protein CopC [Microlunatus aurantiacus]|uniref:Copper resistance protein CopC n=1 Tax=Microlunatus aurantiacus TaxID=446786 RepID=A0ABP7DF96_9ACTN